MTTHDPRMLSARALLIALAAAATGAHGFSPLAPDPRHHGARLQLVPQPRAPVLRAAVDRSPLLGAQRARRGAASAVRLSDAPAPQAAAPPRDLTGDAGVLKTTTTAGTAPPPRRSATVQIRYTARLAETGEVVDAPEEPVTFTLGEGDVITGWEVAVAAMQVGECAKVTLSPAYAYGELGQPPAIPPGASLEYDIELLGTVTAAPAPAAAPAAPAAGTPTPPAAPMAGADTASTDTIPQPLSMADLERPDIARSPAEIAAQYEARMAERKAVASGAGGGEGEGGGLIGAIVERLRTAYIFGLFDSQTGEPAPWYLNPLITFPAMFAFVGFGTWLVTLTGAFHIGTPGGGEAPLPF